MTERKKRFAEEYLICGNATQAAIRAGYSEKTAECASQWINPKNPEKPTSKFDAELKAYIDERLEELHSEKTADAQEVVEYLTAVMRGEQKEEVPLLCGEGKQELAEKDTAIKDRLKAAELLGKYFGMFTDNVRLTGDMGVQIIDNIPDGTDPAH